MKTHSKFYYVVLSLFIMPFAYAQISNSEKEGLKYMYEEEKLADDVYVEMSKLYTLPIFSNITQSEAYQMLRVSELLDTYEVSYSKDMPTGVFENKTLQKLYNELIAKGKNGLLDALTVGATIEDVDIFDLEKLIGETKSKDILEVFTLLKCGSENHMRAFSRQLNRIENTYIPQFINPKTYAEILDASNGPCIQ